MYHALRRAHLPQATRAVQGTRCQSVRPCRKCNGYGYEDCRGHPGAPPYATTRTPPCRAQSCVHTRWPTGCNGHMCACPIPKAMTTRTRQQTRRAPHGNSQAATLLQTPTYHESPTSLFHPHDTVRLSFPRRAPFAGAPSRERDGWRLIRPLSSFSPPRARKMALLLSPSFASPHLAFPQ